MSTWRPFYADIVGSTAISCGKTVGESDVYLFAGITGDFSPNHVDEESMRKTQPMAAHRPWRAAGGLHVAGLDNDCEKCGSVTSSTYPVSFGYDKIRFLKPVFIGDTITVTYVMTDYDEARSRSSATIEITKGGNEVVASAIHLMKWLNR